VIDPKQVSAVLVTHNNVDLTEILASIKEAGIDDIVVWDNEQRRDMSCYGRYAGIAEAKNPYIFQQDDDLVAPVADILAAYDPVVDRHSIVANNRADEEWLLTAMGVVFHRDLADCFSDYIARYCHDDDDWADFCRVSDVVFAYQHPYRRIVLPYRDLAWAATPERMHLQPDHYWVRERARERTLGLRDSRTVAIVTPWHDHPELADDYFAALEIGPPPDELIVVDNGSDPPLEYAAARLDWNEGFSPGCNAGLNMSTADIVVFLNNDVIGTDWGWLRKLVSQVDDGVLVGTSLRWDVHGDVDQHQLPYLDGWCLAATRQDLLEVGGFDESYLEPSYYSDNDLCLRARAAGMTLREIPIGLVHKGGMTAGPVDGPEVQKALNENYRRFQKLARDLMGAVA